MGLGSTKVRRAVSRIPLIALHCKVNVASSLTGTVVNSDLSAGQYVASAGQLEPGEFPDSNNGVFYRNSRNGQRDITDGSRTTLMVGERSRNVADATWVGAVPV